MNTLSDTSEYLLPAGAEFMRETPETPSALGEVACLASLENGSMDADGTGTTNSADPGSMDPAILFDSVAYTPNDDISLN